MAAVNPAAEYLGKAVTAARAERGMKRTELEEKSGLSYAYLSEIEKGRKYPSRAAIDKLADALGMPSFARDLTPSQVRVIQAYVLDQALRESRAPSVRP